jgi:hypothetical protein
MTAEPILDAEAEEDLREFEVKIKRELRTLAEATRRRDLESLSAVIVRGEGATLALVRLAAGAER